MTDPTAQSAPPPALDLTDAVTSEAEEEALHLVTDLRAELELATDAKRKAAIQHAIAVLFERELDEEPEAIRQYLGAYNHDPSFRPPLLALTRLFERRRSFKNLGKLYEAETRSAHDAADLTSSMLDRAMLLEDHLDETAEGTALLRAIVEARPAAGIPALMLERSARRGGDEAVAMSAVDVQASAARDPTMKALLLTEAALWREKGGDVDEALAMLEQAASLPVARWRVLETMEQVARRNDRSDALARSLEERARFVLAEGEGDSTPLGSGAFSVARFDRELGAHALAAALFFEAARVHAGPRRDLPAAIEALKAAVSLGPDDPVLHQELLLVSELAGDAELAADAARRLLAGGARGAAAAALHFRLSRIADAQGDGAQRTARLAAAAAADPSSATARALLDDRLFDEGDHARRVERAKEAAAQLDGEARAERLFEAAHVLCEELGEFEAARSLYREAADASEQPAPILRELYAQAIARGELEAALETGGQLLGLDVDEQERSALLRDRAVFLEASGADSERRSKTLMHAMGVEAANAWAPEAARLRAALTGDRALLAVAHRRLAERAWDDATGAAHLVAAARAASQAGDEEAAVASLREALERTPGHPYAVALLEELLLARGEADEAVALLRQAADAQAGVRHAERAMLVAGAAAEAAGDTALAAETFRDAMAQSPEATSPAWALHRLGLRANQSAWVAEALEALSDRERAAGAPGRGALALGEHHALVTGDAGRAQACLGAVLEADDGARSDYAAALLLTLDPTAVDAELRVAAAERLCDRAGEAASTALLQLAAGIATAVDPEGPQARRATDALIARDASCPIAQLPRLLDGGGDEAMEARADALTVLGERATDQDTVAALLLHAMRVRLFASDGEGVDDAFLLAQEISERAPGSAAAAVAVDETLDAGDDPEARAEALAARLAHASEATAGALRSARGRALSSAGRGEEAVAVLEVALADAPDDLSAWEAMRIAARDAGAWARVTEACDRLAELAEGRFRAQLLEEGGAVAMDNLEDDAGAERRFRAALDADPTSAVAYGRLHDLLVEQERTADLLSLVTEHVDHEDDGEALAAAFYEQARLLRAVGERDAALTAIENLLMLDEHHAGGIALEVEIHVSLEAWAQAVDALRRLAGCDVTAAQKRIARLGAADFLEKKIEDAPAALEELRALEAEGLADGPVFTRMADIAERAEMLEEAVAWLDAAIERARGAEKVRLAKRAGQARERLGYDAGAVRSYQVALGESPTDLEAAEAVAHLLTVSSERVEHSRRFERSVRAAIDPSRVDLEAVRKLREAAGFRGDHGLAHVALDALVALGVATEDELDAIDQDTQLVRMSAPSPEVGARTLGVLRAPGDEGPLAELLRIAGETLTEVDGLDPAGFGVGRRELVGPKPPHPVRHQLEYIASLFALQTGEVYIGGNDPNRTVAFTGKKDKLTWILGSTAAARPEPVLRFHAGRQAAAAAAGTTSLISRTPAEAATLVFALFEAGEAPLGAGVGRAGLNEWSRALAKALPRRIRRAIPELATRVPDEGRSVEAYCAAVRQTALRAGTLVSGSLLTAFAEATGSRPSPESIASSPAALDLFHFWISNGAMTLRRELGLST